MSGKKIAAAIAWLRGDHDREKEARRVIGRILRGPSSPEQREILLEVANALEAGRIQFVTTKKGRIAVLR
jgi:hypothetical protein